MTTESERNLGPQPIATVMSDRNLKPHDLVVASTDQLTHKMVSRATKGRRLTDNTKRKVIAAIQLAADHKFTAAELFNY